MAEWPFVDQAVGVRLAKASTWCGWRISEAAHLPRKGAFNVVEDGVLRRLEGDAVEHGDDGADLLNP